MRYIDRKKYFDKMLALFGHRKKASMSRPEPDHTKPPRAVLGAVRAVAAVKNYRDK